jgi:hypothetical protein
MEIVSGALRAEGGKIFDLEIAGFLKVVVVGDKVWVFLCPKRAKKSRENQRNCGNQENTSGVQANLLRKGINKTNLVVYQMQVACI